MSQQPFWFTKRKEAETGFYLMVFSHLILKCHTLAPPGPGWSEPVGPEPDQPRGLGTSSPSCSQAAVDPSLRGSQSVGLEASQGCVSVTFASHMWQLGRRPQDLLPFPWDPHTSVKRTGPGPWAVPLWSVASHRPGEERPRLCKTLGQGTQEDGG